MAEELEGDEEAEKEDSETTSPKLINDYIRTHITNRFFRWLFKNSLFLITLDENSIYKRSTYRHRDAPRYQLYQTNALKIELGKRDLWLARWRRFCRLLVIYFCIKCTAIVLAQVALNICRQSVTGTRTGTGSGTTILSSKPSSSVCHWEAWLVFWVEILGNPVIALPGVSIFICSLLVIILNYTPLYLFHQYTIEPIDSAETRLWLEPSREFRRIDIIIMQTLRSFGRPLKHNCQCRRRDKRQKCAFIKPDLELMANRDIQAQIIGWFTTGFWYLRPAIYTFHWYQTINRFIINISYPIIITVTALGFGIFYPLINYLLEHGTSEGYKWLNLSVHQLITASETLLASGLVGLMCILQMIIFLTLCYSQTYLLADVKHQLMVCIDELRRMNCGQYNTLDHLSSICVTLKPLIKISLTLDELKGNMRFLTQMVSINVVVSSSACICILCAGYVDGERLADFRYVLILFHWLWANLILTGCAYIYTCALKLETIAWSLVAELRAWELRNDWLMYEAQVAGSWRRLISSRCFSNHEMSVRPFGISLTYDRALQLNYLAISFAGLLKSL